jgi:tagatose 1,6-diphosphate aldolase GatY/KbaY
MIVNMIEMLRTAGRDGYAVGAFNIVNDASLHGAVLAAEQGQSPLIIQTSPSTVKQIGVVPLAALFRAYAGPSPVPIALHLDHCQDLALIRACIDAGWTSVMIDASSLPFEENVRLTREVVAMAHPAQVSVEAELGEISGVEEEIHVATDTLADPAKAPLFVAQSGCDVLAPAIGTAHGVYKGVPQIDTARMAAISRAVSVPTVVHGGTGLSRAMFRTLIDCGAAKINVSTQLKIAYIDATRQYIADHPTEYNPLKVIKAGREAVQATVAEFLEIFGSIGKAAAHLV